MQDPGQRGTKAGGPEPHPPGAQPHPPARPGPRPGSRCTPACCLFSRLSVKGCPGVTPSGHFTNSCVSKLFGCLRIDPEVDEIRTTTLAGTIVMSWWRVTCWHGSLPDGLENDAARAVSAADAQWACQALARFLRVNCFSYQTLGTASQGHCRCVSRQSVRASMSPQGTSPFRRVT